MGSNIQVKVETLSDEEAWELFMKTFRIGTPLTPKIKVTKSLVEECVGLEIITDVSE